MNQMTLKSTINVKPFDQYVNYVFLKKSLNNNLSEVKYVK